jgi:hypothetical protein
MYGIFQLGNIASASQANIVKTDGHSTSQDSVCLTYHDNCSPCAESILLHTLHQRLNLLIGPSGLSAGCPTAAASVSVGSRGEGLIHKGDIIQGLWNLLKEDTAQKGSPLCSCHDPLAWNGIGCLLHANLAWQNLTPSRLLFPVKVHFVLKDDQHIRQLFSKLLL